MLILAMLILMPAAYSADQAVAVKVWTARTDAGASAPLRNIGQSQHLLTVLFPGRTEPVEGLQLRIEASFDQVRWFAISSDLTTAPAIGGRVYQIVAAYGPFPYIRVRSITAAPSPMDLWYSGSIIATVPAVQQETDRFLL